MIREDINDILSVKGVVEFYKRKAGETDWVFEGRENLVTTFARKVIRDLVLGRWVTQQGQTDPAKTIVYLGLGDMNLTLAEAQKGVPAPSLDDKTLVNPTAWVPVEDPVSWPNNNKEGLEYDGRPTIKYTFYLSTSQANTASGFFCELALCIDKDQSPDAYTVTKLNRLPIVKTDQDELLIQYYLKF